MTGKKEGGKRDALERGRRVAFLDSTRFDWHEGPYHHPERPARSTAIRARLRGRSWENQLVRPTFGAVDEELLRQVHSAKYLSELQRLSAFGGGDLDQETYVTDQSYDIACLAAGAVQAAVQAVVRGDCHRAFCAVRPPGHHATQSRGMGYCLLNNVVIGAYAALQFSEISRVAIFDWDVHHGNGTEALTYERSDVFYASTHQYPAYPYTGDAEGRGVAAGKGCNLNVPLSPGFGDQALLSAWDEQICPAFEKFRPDLVLISAGFDADERDPLASLSVTTAGFAQLTARVVAFADEHCSGRIVSVLEGGYDLDAVAEDVCAHVEGLL